MIDYEILTLKEPGKWRDYFLKLPVDQQDIYFTPGYYCIYEKLGDGKALCFAYNKNREIAIYPFLLNSVNDLGYNLDKQYYDIQGAYGYNGVAASSYSESFKKSFYLAFQNFIEKYSIIAEFTRFNPVLKNNLFSSYLCPRYNQANIVLELTQNNIEKNCYEYSTRKNIKKALRNNLGCVKYNSAEMTQRCIEEFVRIYYATMKRNNAGEYYFFPFSYFSDIITNLADNSAFYFVVYENAFIAAELITFGTNIAYSFLGGTLAEYFELRPNDLLKDYIIKDLKKNNIKYFCFGGGSEGIIRFKRSFCKNGDVDFYIGKKVHHKQVYDEVIKQWEKRFPGKKEKYKNILLKYRY